MKKLVVLSVLVAMFAVLLSGCGRKRSFADFKIALGVDQGQSVRLTETELHSRVGRPFKTQAIGTGVYLYYRVKEGTVQLSVEKAILDGYAVGFDSSNLNLM